MASKILKCLNCNKYTLKAVCKDCGTKTLSTKPQRFSPEDKYTKYRILYKKKIGLIK